MGKGYSNLISSRHHRAGEARSGFCDLGDDLGGSLAEQLAIGCQACGKGGAINERRTQPQLERLDAATKRRLRYVAQLSCARKVSGFRDRQKILKPPDVHVSA